MATDGLKDQIYGQGSHSCFEKEPFQLQSSKFLLADFLLFHISCANDQRSLVPYQSCQLLYFSWRTFVKEHFMTGN